VFPNPKTLATLGAPLAPWRQATRHAVGKRPPTPQGGFAYADAEHASAFDDLLGLLRASEEWHFVERAVEVRLSR
jgi:hypothetical protein